MKKKETGSQSSSRTTVLQDNFSVAGQTISNSIFNPLQDFGLRRFLWLFGQELGVMCGLFEKRQSISDIHKVGEALFIDKQKQE